MSKKQINRITLEQNIEYPENHEKIFLPIENTKEQTFTILDSTWFRKMIDNIKIKEDIFEIAKQLWDKKARAFFLYLVSSEEVEFEKKELFLWSMFRDFWQETELFKIFRLSEFKYFWKICLENNLINKDDYLGNFDGFLKYLKWEIVDIVNSPRFEWKLDSKILDFLNEKEIEEIILNKRHIKSFANMLAEGKIIKKVRFSNEFQEKIIDYIFENHKEMVNIYEWKNAWGKNSLIKDNINRTISKLIFNNTTYFFEKIMSLNQNDFKKAVQKTYLTPILYYLKKTWEANNENTSHFSWEDSSEDADIKEFDDELMKKFFKKLVDIVWINDLNTNWRVDSYYKYVKRFNENALKWIDINRVFERTTSADEYIEYDMVNKLLSTENWIQKCFDNVKHLGFLREVIKNHKVCNHVLNNFSDKEIIKYLIIINNDIISLRDHVMLSFFDNLITKISGEKNKNYVNKIIRNGNIIDFISLYREDFPDFKSILTNRSILMLSSLEDKQISNVNKFISLVRKTLNLNFELKLENIDERFFKFIKNVFYVSWKWRDWETDFNKHKNFYRKLNDFYGEEISKIFDVEINNYENFLIKDPKSMKLETWILYEDTLLDSNLKEICDLYNLPFSISSFRQIEESYNEYLGNNEENYVYLENILKRRNISENMDFFTKYFKEILKDPLSINELLTWLETSKNNTCYNNWLYLVRTLEIFNEHLDWFNAKDIVYKWDDKKLHIKEIEKWFFDKLFFDGELLMLNEFLKIFKNITLNKLIKLNKNYTEIFSYKDEYWHKRKGIEHFIWDPYWFEMRNYSSSSEEKTSKINAFEINRVIIQNAIDTDNYENLWSSLQVIQTNFITHNSIKLLWDNEERKNIMSELLNKTWWYLDGELFKNFIPYNSISYHLDEQEKVTYQLEELDYILQLTQIDFKDKKFQNIETSLFLSEVLKDKEKYQKIFTKENKIKFNEIFSYNISLDVFYKHLEFILSTDLWLFYGYFSKSIENDEKLPENFPITLENFLDNAPSNIPLFNFKKDQWIKMEWIQPWTEQWFLEKKERLGYLEPDKIKTFKKFGTIVWLWVIEWSQKPETLSNFYNLIFNNISLKKSRSSILQLWEVFNLILKQENYEILDNLIGWEVKIWQKFKEFIEKYNISDKWRTILTLMIAREINLSFAIFKDKEWKQQIDSMWVKEMLLSVYNKLERYKEVIKIFDKIPVKTSIWVEIEVTKSIAYWYKEQTWSDYKNDISILSEYSGIAEWNDAIHEIATKPTDNPYLLLLELKLLEDLDFLDLNFKKEDYSKWSRWLHITVWWEKGIALNKYTNFIQNILIASNLWWLNAWKEIKRINHFGNIREKNLWDMESLFGDDKISVEYRSLSIDKTESFEKLILAIFNLNMLYQIFRKVLKWKTDNILEIDIKKDFENIESFKKYILNINPELFEVYNEKEEEKIEKLIWLAYKFIVLLGDIREITKNHNENFEKEESIIWKHDLWLEKLITLFSSTSPAISIMRESWININYLKKLEKLWITNINSFISYLKNDNKEINALSDRQLNILFWTYKIKIKPELEKLRKENTQLYENIETYLSEDLEDMIRKITNKKRFESVIDWDKNYLENIKFSIEDLFNIITPELINKFTRINNLFIKKDSSNALSAFDTTIEPNWEKISDSKLTETMIFDKMELWLEERRWYNLIQWAGENMIIQAIQREILNLTYSIIDELKK